MRDMNGKKKRSIFTTVLTFFFLSVGDQFLYHFSSDSPLTAWVVGGHEGLFSIDSLPIHSVGGHCEQLRRGQECPLFEVVHPGFPLPTRASFALKGTLKDGCGEAVMARDVPGS